MRLAMAIEYKLVRGSTSRFVPANVHVRMIFLATTAGMFGHLGNGATSTIITKAMRRSTTRKLKWFVAYAIGEEPTSAANSNSSAMNWGNIAQGSHIMGETKIEWADFTFNPWVGCTKVSAACDHCYAEGWAKRTGHLGLWQGARRRTSEANWRQPLKWNAKAEETGARPRVFCASLADVFDNQVPPDWRMDLFALIECTPNLDWLLLTKRPQNIRKMAPIFWQGPPMPNVWLGTTTEDQAEYDLRYVKHLSRVPAVVRFISYEPALGELSIVPSMDQGHPLPDWVIAGGESGPKARPPHPDWFRDLRHECRMYDIPFLFKQWGEWAPRPSPYSDFENRASRVVRLGKKAAGRELDGMTYTEFPEARA